MIKMDKKILFSASMICADFKNLAKVVKALEKEGLDTLHFDFCDGHFAPTLLFSPIVLKSIRSITNLRFDAHMYCEYPSRYLDELSNAGTDLIIVQVESKEDYREVISKVIKKGMKAGIGILPGSEIPENISDVFPEISLIVANTVGPAYFGQTFDDRGLEHMKEIKKLVLENNYDIEIGADGGVGIQSFERLFKSGANLLICGTTSIFGDGKNPPRELKKLKSYINKYIN